ncbi:VOC family protein [Pseudovibrio ascidiaceicola]|uniref:VOC family protein n=1 Tax=Pseudovibrio ascidiaceicola TaxID=285279 RepID=UPI003D36D784
MTKSFLEHVNITVSDPIATASRLSDWFDWHVRWQGSARAGGTTVHVGTDDSYIAVYSLGNTTATKEDNYVTHGSLNHVGVVVDDLDAVEKKVLAGGYETRNHADYEPGRRFYFDDDDGIEFEVVSYA